MFKKIIIVAVIAVMLGFTATQPVTAALTSVELQAQIKELLARVADLTRQLSTLRGQGSGMTTPSAPPMPVPPTPGPQRRICLIPYRNLAEGQSGDEVKALQEFLQSENILTVTPTGFFGPLTREALKRWQTQQGIDPAGVAGPRTGERLRLWCGGTIDIDRERFSAAPLRGEAPLTVTFSTWISGFRAPGVEYIIDFGDGTASEEAADCNAPADACISAGQNKHTYKKNGTYTATLTKMTSLCNDTPSNTPMCAAPTKVEVVGKALIHVGTVSCTKEYAPVCGGQPIVCITTPCNPIPTTYSNRCMMEAEGASFLYVGQCRSTTANKPPTISGFSGPTTLRVDATGTWTINATDPENGQLTYSIDWGDNNVLPSTDAASVAPGMAVTQNTTFTHAYEDAGTYTVTIIVSDNQGQASKASATVKVGNLPTSCTLEYRPVCGVPPGCVNTCAPGQACPAICQLPPAKTYGNRCQLDVAEAQFLHTGRCSGDERVY